MKRFLAIILAFIIFITATGCWEVRREPLTKKQERGGLIYIVNEQAVYSGMFVEQYKNGQNKLESYYKNGRLDGTCKEWYENGQLKVESTYKDGKLNGVRKEWYENSQQKNETSYKNDQFDGVYKEWSENGQLKSEMSYKNDKFAGIYNEWLENGQLKSETSFQDSIKDGVYKEWSANGQLKSEKPFKVAELAAINNRWHGNDQPTDVISYKSLMKSCSETLAFQSERPSLLLSRVSCFSGKVEYRNVDTWATLNENFEFDKKYTFKTDADSTVNIQMQLDNQVKLLPNTEITISPPTLAEDVNKVEKEPVILRRGELTAAISFDGRRVLEIEVADIVVGGISGLFKVIFDEEKAKGEVVVKNGLVEVNKKLGGDRPIKVSGYYKVTFDKSEIKAPIQADVNQYDWRE